MNAFHTHPILDFWCFLRRPVAERLSEGMAKKVFILIVVISLNILISMILSLLDIVIEVGGGAVEPVEIDVNPLLLSVGAVFIAPLTEEIVFRLGLAPNLWFLFISLFLASVQYAPKLLGDFFGDDGMFVGFNVLFYLVLSAGICLFFWFRERRGHRYVDFFNRYVGAYYYLGALLFALPHLGNFTYRLPWWLVILPVLPQLFGGLTFGYLRIRLGFWYGVMGHLLHNLLFTLGDVLTYFLGATANFVWLIVLIIVPIVVLMAPFLVERQRQIASRVDAGM